MSYSEAFATDDPTLMDRYPIYDLDKHLGDSDTTTRGSPKIKSKQKDRAHLYKK